MNNIYSDEDYLNIVNNILNNDKYIEISNCLHHGTSRLIHSLKVSYYSYKIAKLFKLDYQKTAIGGLLHDFFVTNNHNGFSKVSSTFKHPVIALNNSSSEFLIGDKEKDIIVSHMFPIVINKIPKYFESWIVSMVDKIIGAFEFGTKYKKLFTLKFSNNLILLTLIIRNL